ncbi:hypothetical protein [Vallitalea maricola]
MLLEKCKDVDEAIKLLENVPSMTSKLFCISG